MKKTFAIITIFIIFFCLYFFQSRVFNTFTIAGVAPNLFIILALFLGLYLNKLYTPFICTVLGLLLDFFYSDIIGINAIMLLVASIGGMLFVKNFSKESRITITIISIAMTFICEFIVYVLRIIILNANIEILAFFKIIFIEIIYNAILIIILYPLIQKFGNWIENRFTEDKILTKYF